MEKLESMVSNAYEVMTSSRLRRLIIALVFTGLIYWVANSAWIVNNTNDDWAISIALSGRWGDVQGLCLFLNALLSQIIFALNGAFPAFNWFALVESTCAFLAYFTVAYVALSRMTAAWAGLAIAAFTFLAVPGSTYFDNFTYVACLCCSAGILCLAIAVREGNQGIAYVIVGTLFMALGTLWRWQMFLLSLPFLGICALALCFRAENRGVDVAKRILALWPIAVAVLLCVGLRCYDTVCLAEQPWADWRANTIARAQITDYPSRPYSDIESELQALGVSENDYYLLDHWVSEDTEFYTTELIAEVGSLSRYPGVTLGEIPDVVVSFAKTLWSDKKLIAVMLLIVVALCASVRRSTIGWGVLLIACAFAFSLYFQSVGRLLERVNEPIWLYAVVGICVCSMLAITRPDDGSKGEASERPKPLLGAFGSVVGAASFAGPVLAGAFVLMLALPNVSAVRLEAIFAADTFEPTCSLTEYMDEHPDRAFVFDVSSNQDIKYASQMRAIPSKRFLSQAVGIGGWDGRAPYAIENNEKLGMGNPLRNLAENENAVFITEAGHEPKRILTFIREHYYPKATYHKIDTIEDSAAYGSLDVYRFSKD